MLIRKRIQSIFHAAAVPLNFIRHHSSHTLRPSVIYKTRKIVFAHLIVIMEMVIAILTVMRKINRRSEPATRKKA